jgi:hypothetical protein
MVEIRSKATTEIRWGAIFLKSIIIIGSDTAKVNKGN